MPSSAIPTQNVLPSLQYHSDIPPTPAHRATTGEPFKAIRAEWEITRAPFAGVNIWLYGAPVRTAGEPGAGRIPFDRRSAMVSATVDAEGNRSHAILWPNDTPTPPLWVTQAFERLLDDNADAHELGVIA